MQNGKLNALFKTIYKLVQKDAPKWGAGLDDEDNEKPVRYNFDHSIDVATGKLATINMPPAGLAEAAWSWAGSEFNIDNFPHKAMVGWTLGVIAATLETEKRNDFIDALLQLMFRNRTFAHTTADLVLPAFLDALPKQTARRTVTRVAAHLKDLIDEGDPTKQNAWFGSLFDTTNHIGAYNLPAPRKQIAAVLFNKLNVEELVNEYKGSFNNWQTQNIFTDLMEILPPEGQKQLALAIHKQEGPGQIVAMAEQGFESDGAGFVFAFLGNFFTQLPEAERTALATLLLKKVKQGVMMNVLLHHSYSGHEPIVRDFIAALPPAPARELVQKFAAFVLKADMEKYEFDAYRATNDGHRIVPPAYIADYMQVAYDYLARQDNAPAVKKRAAAFKVAAMFRQQLEGVNTAEVDFHKVRRNRMGTLNQAGITLHLKPGAGQPGAVLMDFFKGTVETFQRQIENPKNKNMAPRGLPADEREVFPREVFPPVLAAIRKTEAELLAKPEAAPALPALKDVLAAKIVEFRKAAP